MSSDNKNIHRNAEKNGSSVGFFGIKLRNKSNYNKEKKQLEEIINKKLIEAEQLEAKQKKISNTSIFPKIDISEHDSNIPAISLEDMKKQKIENTTSIPTFNNTPAINNAPIINNIPVVNNIHTQSNNTLVNPVVDNKVEEKNKLIGEESKKEEAKRLKLEAQRRLLEEKKARALEKEEQKKLDAEKKKQSEILKTVANVAEIPKKAEKQARVSLFSKLFGKSNKDNSISREVDKINDIDKINLEIEKQKLENERINQEKAKLEKERELKNKAREEALEAKRLEREKKEEEKRKKKEAQELERANKLKAEQDKKLALQKEIEEKKLAKEKEKQEEKDIKAKKKVEEDIVSGDEGKKVNKSAKTEAKERLQHEKEEAKRLENEMKEQKRLAKEEERKAKIKEKFEEEQARKKKKEDQDLIAINEKKEKKRKLKEEREQAKKERKEKAELINKAKEESKEKSKSEKKPFKERLNDWYNNIPLVKDRQNRRELQRQTLLIDFENESAVRSDEKIMYKYVAKNTETGKIETGYFGAYSKLEVHSFLLAEDYEVYEITPQKKFISPFNKQVKKMSSRDLDFFLTQLSTFLKSGITLVEAVKILSKQTNKTPIKNLYKSIIYELSLGENFSEALSKQGEVFPRLLINMVKTSELTGDLPETLDDMAAYYRATEQTRKQMISALIYPIVVLVFAFTVLIFIMVSVIPQFVDIYSSMDAELPGITKTIISVSNFLSKYWITVIAGVFAFIILFIVLFKTIKVFRTGVQTILMNLPVLGKIIIYNEVTMFTKTFASLLNHSVYITDCMEVLSKITNNEVYKMLIFDTITNLAKGEAISNSFKNQWAFPNIAYEMILTGEKTGQLGEMMDKVANYYDEQHRNTIAQIKALIEPVMIVILALIVGVVLMSVVLPMFDMYENIGAF